MGCEGSPTTSFTTPSTIRTMVPQPPWQLRQTALISCIAIVGASASVGLDIRVLDDLREFLRLASNQRRVLFRRGVRRLPAQGGEALLHRSLAGGALQRGVDLRHDFDRR